MRGMPNAATLINSFLLALRHSHMASLSSRVALSALLAGLASGCATGTATSRAADADKSLNAPLSGTTVTGEDLDRAGNDPIEKTLAAKVPGVIVTQTPDGGLSLRIRGNVTIGGNTQPLFIIDGLAVNTGPDGALKGINPHDIASIEVLKDAASLSFYGVRAANGVILIKTKHSN